MHRKYWSNTSKDVMYVNMSIFNTQIIGRLNISNKYVMTPFLFRREGDTKKETENHLRVIKKDLKTVLDTVLYSVNLDYVYDPYFEII